MRDITLRSGDAEPIQRLGKCGGQVGGSPAAVCDPLSGSSVFCAAPPAHPGKPETQFNTTQI